MSQPQGRCVQIISHDGGLLGEDLDGVVIHPVSDPSEAGIKEAAKHYARMTRHRLQAAKAPAEKTANGKGAAQALVLEQNQVAPAGAAAEAADGQARLKAEVDQRQREESLRDMSDWLRELDGTILEKEDELKDLRKHRTILHRLLEEQRPRSTILLDEKHGEPGKVPGSYADIRVQAAQETRPIGHSESQSIALFTVADKELQALSQKHRLDKRAESRLCDVLAKFDKGRGRKYMEDIDGTLATSARPFASLANMTDSLELTVIHEELQALSQKHQLGQKAESRLCDVLAKLWRPRPEHRLSVA